MKEPSVTVGIMSEEKIDFVFKGTYLHDARPVEGEQEVHLEQGLICWKGHKYDTLLFVPQCEENSFCLKGVTIGVKFHWERKEDQVFKGALKLIVEGDRITAINELSIEGVKPESLIRTDHELIRWYDREDHDHFDVCADDHCQRYQGITRASTEIVARAIDATRGEILSYDKKICDARFSKCCGGVVEEFSTCWENINHPYLKPLRDSREESDFPDLRNEEEARAWIYASPEAFCNTTDKNILSQVLNNYDQETTDFYRWTVSYTQQELAALIREKSGIDFGEIVELKPIERGRSGRLIRLQIIGTRQTLTIGKELEIRRTLSPSHLYSSAFVVEHQDLIDGIPQRFVLRGAGWGHGVGLCQIGAAVMGEQGFSYREILLHYFVGATIEKLY